jgi:MYXO-CTERM domain-containing protein
MVCAGDCDDVDETRSPALADTCGDGVDNNCDGQVDETCPPADEEGGCGCSAAGAGPARGLLSLLLIGAASYGSRRRSGRRTASVR